MTFEGRQQGAALARVDEAETVGDEIASRAPRPGQLVDTGLSAPYLADLVAKHLHQNGVLALTELSRRCALAGGVMEEVLALLRDEARIEVRGGGERGNLCFGLTDRGRASALEALARDGYIGPAPVTLDDYTRQVEIQALSRTGVDRDSVHAIFADTVIAPEVLDRLGPALHSGRATFIYGAAGTGKSFIARRLTRLLRGQVLVPHSILVAGKAVKVFDGGVHRPVADTMATPEHGVLLAHGHDPRYVRCERPLVVVGGELTAEMLEVQYDDATRVHQAPLQLRANNGLLVIDDLGRQRIEPITLFNRWIVPLEERHDYLGLRDGQPFRVPFDVSLVFSTNLSPLDLADPAFLRRIGYKIRFDALSRDDYLAIWAQECRARGLEASPALAAFVIDDLHGRFAVPLLPCHPRDLLGLALDYLNYRGEQALTVEALRWAWQNYFMELGDTEGEAS